MIQETITIAVDFDGTIVEDAYPSIGKPQLFAFDTLKKLQAKGHRLILWTYRHGKALDEAVATDWVKLVADNEPDACVTRGYGEEEDSSSYPNTAYCHRSVVTNKRDLCCCHGMACKLTMRPWTGTVVKSGRICWDDSTPTGQVRISKVRDLAMITS